MKKLLSILLLIGSLSATAQRVVVNVNVTVDPDSAIFRKKISYPFNLGSTFSQFSLVDKNYVDSLVLASISGGSFTYSNGIIESAGNVKLGGRLTNSTNISGRFLYDLYLDSLTSFNLKTSGNLFFYYNNISWLMLLGGVPQMIYPDGTGNVAVSLASTGASILGGVGSSITVSTDSSRITKRLSYASNIASSFTLYSLVTKRYVDSIITTVGAGGSWGSITGTLSSQTDLQTALNGKLATGLAFLLSDTAAKTWAFTDITGVPSFLTSVDTSNISNFSVKIKSLFTASSPLIYNSGTGGFSIQAATSGQNGYLSSGDWTTFNNKQSTGLSFLLADTAAKTWAWTDITGTPNYQLVGATFFIGTTSIANNRASASQALTGITSIDGSAATLTTTRTLWGQNFNGSANVTGDITLGINSITMTGSIAATGARVTKGWFTDVESTNMFTVGGTSLTTVTQVFQNKTMTNSNNVLGGVTMTLGSDASWDLYVRNASGILERLGNGTTGQFLGANTAAKPSWQTPSGSGGITIATTTITGGVSGKVLYNNAGVVDEADANFTNYTSLANKDLLWYNSATSEWNNITVATLKTELGTPANITGLITQGTNVTITGSGTAGSPYVINSSGSGGTYTGSGSIVLTAFDFTLVNDNATPGNNYVYSTNSSGTKAWQQATVTNFTSLANKDLMWYNSTSGEWNNITIPNLATNMQLYKLPYDPAPTAAGADTLKVFNYKVGGRNMLGTIDPDGVDNAAQYHLTRNGFAGWFPAGNSTTVSLFRTAAISATGTATASNYATTTRHTQMRRVEYLVTVAATTAVAGFRETANQYMRGSTTGDGGFHFVCRFGPATGVATATNRCFVGMSTNTGAPTDVEPSTLLNMIGFGWDAADANIQFFNNDGSGTAVKNSTGLAVPTADRTAVYEVSMYCKPAGTTIYYTIKDLVSGSSYSSFVNTDIPGATTGLSPRGWMSVGGTSSVIGIALMSLSIESDY